MTSSIIKISIISIIVSVLYFVGNGLNDVWLIPRLTDFFVLLRTITKPLEFFWDFTTSIHLIGLSLGLLLAYYSIKAVITILNIFKDNN